MPPTDPGRTAGASPETPEPVWRDERRGRPHIFGPLYRSGYLDTFLVGRLDDGRDLVLAAGVHSRHYPFFHARAKWDDLLLIVGDQRLMAVGRNVSSLTLALGPKARAAVGFHGRATSPTGAVADAHLHLDLRATIHAPRAQGIGLRFTLFGLQWQPALVSGSGSVTIDGQRNRITAIAGLMERGSLTNIRGSLFQPALRYLAAAPRPGATPASATDGAAGEPAVYVAFTAQPLAGGLTGLPLRLFLRANPVEEELTLSGTRIRDGDLLGIAPKEGEPTRVLLRHVVDVGPARVLRELIGVGEGEGRRYGFRQITAAHRSGRR